MLCKGRSWLVPIFSVGPTVRMACALPAMLLTVRQTDRRQTDRALLAARFGAVWIIE